MIKSHTILIYGAKAMLIFKKFLKCSAIIYGKKSMKKIDLSSAKGITSSRASLAVVDVCKFGIHSKELIVGPVVELGHEADVLIKGQVKFDKFHEFLLSVQEVSQ